MLTTSMMPTRTLMIPRVPFQHEKRLSSLGVLTCSEQFSFSPVSAMTLEFASRLNLTIRMGGGPRTFPGGVSKWQWKRMQAKKAKQLLKARLCRERQIYEMRKRSELKAAISELERPWEMVEKAPNLFSVKADEQLKVLADRFQKPGGFDMWSEKDGPQVFKTPDGLPTARFFPKDAVHSVRPYGLMADSSNSARPATSLDKGVSDFNDWTTRGNGERSRTSRRITLNDKRGMVDRDSSSFVDDKHGKPYGLMAYSSDSARPATSLDKGVSNFNDWATRGNGGRSRTSRRITPNDKRGMVDRDSSSFVDDKRGKPYGLAADSSDSARPATSLDKGVSNFNDWATRGNGGRSRTSRRITLNDKRGMFDRDSSSFVDDKHGKPARNGVDVYHKTRHGSYEKNGKTLSDEPSYRSSSFNQSTSRPVSKQGAKWSSSDRSTQKTYSVNSYKHSLLLQSRRKLDLRLPYMLDSDDSTEDLCGSTFSS